MFLRSTNRKKDGKDHRYFSVVENRRLSSGKTAQRTERQFPLVGCGGIGSGADAYAKIRAGATLVQLYSAMVYEGPPLVRRIKNELAALLVRDGFASVAEAIGADLR